jgi:hypothetical protein
VAPEEEIPAEVTARDERQFGYYQVGREEGQQNATINKYIFHCSSGFQLCWPCRPSCSICPIGFGKRCTNKVVSKPSTFFNPFHHFCIYSGVDLETAISDARSLRSMPSSKRQQEMGKLVQYLNESLELHEPHRTPRYFFCFRFGRSLGSYVSSLYLIIKLLYLVRKNWSNSH